MGSFGDYLFVLFDVFVFVLLVVIVVTVVLMMMLLLWLWGCGIVSYNDDSTSEGFPCKTQTIAQP